MLCPAKGKMGGPIFPLCFNSSMARYKNPLTYIRHGFDSQDRALSNEPIASCHIPSIHTPKWLGNKSHQKERTKNSQFGIHNKILLKLSAITWQTHLVVCRVFKYEMHVFVDPILNGLCMSNSKA